MNKSFHAVEGIDPLVSVQLRNHFYKNLYRKTSIVFFTSLLINLMLGGLLYFMITHPQTPYYFATTINGRVTPIFPLNQPNQSSEAVLQWATSAAAASFTYNYSNYRREFQSAASFFTGNGWAQFLLALKESNNLSAVLSKRLVVSAQALKGAKVTGEGDVGGVYTWRIKIPLLITYQSTLTFTQQNVDVIILILRVSTLNAPAGIGIEQLVVGPADE